MDEPKLSPASHSISPYFMDNDHPDKYVKKGENTSASINIIRDNKTFYCGAYAILFKYVKWTLRNHFDVVYLDRFLIGRL